MKLLASFATALTIFVVTSASLLAQDLADVIEKSELSVVRIEVKGRDGDSIGSGFVVESEGVIVTNVHVLAGAETATAAFRHEKGKRSQHLVRLEVCLLRQPTASLARCEVGKT